MNNSRIVLIFTFSLLCSCVSKVGSNVSEGVRSTGQPNFIVIFTDDMGYGDMSNNGHPTIRTPSLDKMAQEGQKWTNFYVASSVCTPSRAALMTGRYPVRNGMTSSNPRKRVLFPHSKGGLPQSEHTIAESLKELGYKTGMVGKWHLGHLPEYLPTKHGFDSWYGIPYSNDMDLNIDLVKKVNGGDWEFPENIFEGEHWENPKSEYWEIPLMKGDKIIERAPNQHKLTKNYTEKAVDFIKDNKSEPFFLYLAHSMPHVPLFTSDEFKGVSTGGLYGDVIEELDWSVGEVLRVLKEEGLAENTLVIFTSDNGPWKAFGDQGGSAGLLRGGKGETFEGGMREPALFWWPGTIKQDLVHDIGSTLDLLPTLASLAGGETNHQTDGYDLSDVLTRGAEGPRKEMFYYRGEVLFAARVGRYKAHFHVQPPYGAEGPTKLEEPLLFDMHLDPAESRNVADDHPEIIAQITKVVENHKKSVVPVENQLEK